MNCSNYDSVGPLLIQQLDDRAYGSNLEYHVQLCLMSMQVAYAKRNMPMLLHYANEVRPLVENNKEYTYVAAEVASNVAYGLFKLGKTEEALQLVDSARMLMRNYDTWPAFISYCNCTKRKLSILRELKRYDETVSYAADVLVRLDELERDSTILTEVPNFASVQGIIDFNRGQMFGSLCMAYVGLQQEEQVKFWLERVKSTSWASHSLIDEQLMDAYAFLGDREQLLRAIEHIEAACGSDTTSVEYCHCLRRRAELAEEEHNPQLATWYLKRIADLQYMHIREQETEQLTGFMFFYQHQQEEHEKRLSLDRFRFICAVLAALVLLLVALIIYLYYHYRMRDVNRKLYKMAVSKATIEEDDAADEAETETETDESHAADEPVCETSDEVLYARILQIMHDKKLYVNPDFSVQVLAREMGSNRTYISRAINEFAGMNFRSWLCQTRCTIVVSLIKENPAITTLELMQRTGFSSRTTFYRQFEQFTGLTIDEFRRQLSSDTE